MPPRPSADADLDLARRAAVAAGETVMEHFRRVEEVHFKGPGQPVTAADLAADRQLRELLLEGRPDYGWLSEETADSGARLGRRRVWIVDPIDGTNSFVEGRPEFVISLALVDGAEPVVGVVHNPATGEMYEAVRGGGAYRDSTRIRVAGSLPDDRPGTMLVSRSELRRGELDPFRAGWDLVPLGSTAYRMVKIADGTGHLFLSRGPKSEWDVCAAALIVEEAGGRATQIDGARMRYNQPRPVFRGVIATCGGAVLPRLDLTPLEGSEG